MTPGPQPMSMTFSPPFSRQYFSAIQRLAGPAPTRFWNCSYIQGTESMRRSPLFFSCICSHRFPLGTRAPHKPAEPSVYHTVKYALTVAT